MSSVILPLSNKTLVFSQYLLPTAGFFLSRKHNWVVKLSKKSSIPGFNNRICSSKSSNTSSESSSQEDSKRFPWKVHLEEWNVPWDWKIVLYVMTPYLMSILFTGIVESKGNSQYAIQTSIQNTDEVAVKFFVDQLLKTVVKLSVLFVFVSPYQPFSEDVFSYRWKQPLNLKNGWALWGFGGLIAASSCVLLIKGVTSGLSVSQVQNEAEALLRLAPLIGASNISNVSLLGVLGILTPICEETIYRGFLLTSLSKWLPVNVSVFLSAAVFTLAHQSPGKATEIFIFGLALGFVYARTRNLLAPITMHACWNLGVVLILIYFKAQGDDMLKYIG
ncbi:hypothetical protein MKW94_017231 [Papaver nudicaule]|uniref:CAAX prenyl protease 2/Lysostaphin resistance protein A-like domain-containing protein n=1 Tax=Papaver nudicaule TaxID=74823 RepID=A0AA41VI08_PAPNU|nr:hypothetical protein [Papaver nudicaule]